MALQFRRGTAAEVVSQSFVPEIGEPVYITDEQQLYIGDGTTQKGNPVSGATTLQGLTDVKLSPERTNTIASYSITSNVATINLVTPHDYWYYTGISVTISNSSISALNGTHVITAYTLQSVSFALTSPDVAVTVADGDTHIEITTGDILVYDGTNNEFVNFDYSAFFQNPLFSNPHTLSYNLNTNTHDIVSSSSTDVNIAPSTAKAAIKGNSTSAGQLALNCEQNSHAVILKGAPHSAAANYTLTMPSALPGSAGQALTSDTSGNLSFSTVSSDLQTTTYIFNTASAPTGTVANSSKVGQNFGTMTEVNNANGNGPSSSAFDPNLSGITFSSTTGQFSGFSAGRYLVTCEITVVIDNVTPGFGSTLLHYLFAEDLAGTAYVYASGVNQYKPLPYTSYGSASHEFTISMTMVAVCEDATPANNLMQINADQNMGTSYYVSGGTINFVRLGDI